MRWWVAMTMFAVGCGPASSPPDGPPMNTELVGEWFLCDAADCSTLKNLGASWDVNGRWALLEARGVQSLGSTDTYCASPFDANRGNYTFDLATGALVMTDDLTRAAGGGTVTFTEPTASLSALGVVSVYLRLDPSRSTGTCPIN